MQELESGSGLVTKQKWMEKKCVKNYDLGAVTDANFIQCEKLQKKESVVTYGNGVWPIDQVWPIPIALPAPRVILPGTPSLVQIVSADVLGISHIGFSAKDPNEHHHTIAYGREERIGQFQIEKTIEIKLNCSTAQIGDWLGCP